MTRAAIAECMHTVGLTSAQVCQNRRLRVTEQEESTIDIVSDKFEFNAW